MFIKYIQLGVTYHSDEVECVVRLYFLMSKLSSIRGGSLGNGMDTYAKFNLNSNSAISFTTALHVIFVYSAAAFDFITVHFFSLLLEDNITSVIKN